MEYLKYLQRLLPLPGFPSWHLQQQSVSSEDIQCHLLPDQPSVSATPIPGRGRWQGLGRMSRHEPPACGLQGCRILGWEAL